MEIIRSLLFGDTNSTQYYRERHTRRRKKKSDIWIGLDTMFKNKTDSESYSEMKDSNFLD